MSNPSNFGILVGRLAADPKVFTNRDGSRSIKFNVFADNDYKNRDGSRGSQSIPVEAFLRADVQGEGVYALMGAGDLVTISYAIVNNNWIDAQGQKHYSLVLSIDSVQLLESRETTTARRNQKMAQAQSAQQNVQNQAPVAAQNTQAPMQEQVQPSMPAPAAAAAPQYQNQAPVQHQQNDEPDFGNPWAAPVDQYSAPSVADNMSQMQSPM